MQHPALPLSWDIFCNVIDNYGDIGVAWRLARQLHHEHGQQIRLWVDDLSSFARLCPTLNPTLAQQQCDGIEVRRWDPEFPVAIKPGDVVLDAFGCALPEVFLQAMADSDPVPRWINLEYLTAEDWVDSCHGMHSPHPRLPLQRSFFFPGFSAKTGGVLAENNIVGAAQAWQQDPAAQNAFWHQLGVSPRSEDAYRVSLFAYENPAIGDLLQHWSAGKQPVVCLVPEGRILTDITASFSYRPLSAGDKIQRGALTLQVLPFSDQATYDRLLWSCDLNFVRGEDSFMRAQLAQRPFVWHIYPQQDAAHWVKLDAFWNRYAQALPAPARTALLGLNHAWNHGQKIASAWQEFEKNRTVLETHAQHWPQTLLANGDLASRLLAFVTRLA